MGTEATKAEATAGERSKYGGAPVRVPPPLVVGGALLEVVQMAGIGIAANSGWVVLLSPVWLLIVHFTAVLPEERYLSETFGESYVRYCAKVRRYL